MNFHQEFLALLTIAGAWKLPSVSLQMVKHILDYAPWEHIWETWAVYLNVSITSSQATISPQPRVSFLFCLRSFLSLLFLLFLFILYFHDKVLLTAGRPRIFFVVNYAGFLFLGTNPVYNEALRFSLGVPICLRPLELESYTIFAHCILYCYAQGVPPVCMSWDHRFPFFIWLYSIPYVCSTQDVRVVFLSSALASIKIIKT